jgi:HEAT repeat protein
MRAPLSIPLLLAALLLPPPARALDGAGEVPVDPPRALAPAEAELVVILRRARSEEDPAFDALAEEAAAVGVPGIRASLRLLERERVPPLEPEQTEQVLSEPQRELLLAGLARMEREAVLEELADRMALAHDVAGRLLALRVLGAVGDTESLQGLVGLALAEGEEEPPPRLEEALREAIALILVREPSAFDRLHEELRRTPDDLQGVWIAAAGDTGSPRTLELCAHALGFRTELAPIATAQVLRVGRSPHPELNRELVERLRWMLDPTRAGLCRSVLLALGELGDYESIPTLIELLDGPDEGLSQNALWALQRITGLPFPASAQRWRSWYAQELAWFEHEERRVLRDLGSRDPARVSGALREIGRRRTQRESLAVEVLAVLERSEPSLRAQACDTLGVLGAEVALPALVERLEGDIPYCAQAAWRALGSISGLDLPAQGGAWRDALALDA